MRPTLQVIIICIAATILHITTPNFVAESIQYESSFVKRLQYGTTFKKHSVLSMARSFWSHTIVIDLEAFYNLTISPPLCERFSQGTPEENPFIKLCDTFEPTFKAFTDYRKHIVDTISDEIRTFRNLVPKITRNVTTTRTKRSLFGAWSGEIFSKLFHLATLDHVKILMKHVDMVEKQLGKVQRLQITTKELHSYMTHHAEFERLMHQGIVQNEQHINDTYYDLLELSQKVGTGYARLQQISGENTRGISLLHQLHIREISVLQLVLDNTYKLVTGVTQLQKGILPSDLVSPDHLEEILEEISMVLTEKFPQFKILFPHPRQYYDTSLNLVYTSTTRFLYIKIQIPLADNSMIFDVYSIQSIPLTLTPNSSQFSQLTNIPDFLGVSQDRTFFVQLTTKQFSSCTSASLIQCSEVLPLIEKTEPTCTAAIFLNAPYKMVHNICDFTLFPQIVNPVSYFLHTTETSIFVSTNHFDWKLVCPTRLPAKLKGCSLCEIPLHCTCAIAGQDFFLGANIQACLVNATWESKEHTSNIMALYTLYQPIRNLTLTPVDFVKLQQQITIPQINVTLSPYTKKSLRQSYNQLACDLKQAGNQLENNSTLFYTGLDKYFDELPTIPSLPITAFTPVMDFSLAFTMGSTVAHITSFYLIYQLRSRHHVRVPFMDAMPLLHHAESFSFIPNAAWFDDMSDYALIALLSAMTMYLCIRSCFFLIRACAAYSRPMAIVHDTRLMIKLTNTKRCIEAQACIIPGRIQNIKTTVNLRMPPLIPSLEMTCGRPCLRVNWSFLRIRHEQDKVPFVLPPYVPISLAEAVKYQGIIQGNLFLQIVLICGFKQKQVVVYNIGQPSTVPTYPRQIYSPVLTERIEEDVPAEFNDLKLIFHSSTDSSSESPDETPPPIQPRPQEPNRSMSPPKPKRLEGIPVRFHDPIVTIIPDQTTTEPDMPQMTGLPPVRVTPTPSNRSKYQKPLFIEMGATPKSPGLAKRMSRKKLLSLPPSDADLPSISEGQSQFYTVP